MTPAAISWWATLSEYKQGLFYMHPPIDKMVHTTAFGTLVVKHWVRLRPVRKVDLTTLRNTSEHSTTGPHPIRK